MLKQFAFRGAMRDSVDREQSKALSGGSQTSSTIFFLQG
jgi:hypothetical protein